MVMHPAGGVVGRRGLMLFDIDQTMVDIGPQQAAAFAATFQSVYAVPGALADVAFAGMTTPNILRAVARIHGVSAVHAEQQLLRALDTLVTHLKPALDRDLSAACYPGVATLLSTLSSTGHILGVLTGNPPAIGELILRRTGLRQFFAFCTYGTEAVTRADLVRLSIHKGSAMVPALTAADTLVVGDSVEDVRAARAAGARAVLVRHGPLANGSAPAGAAIVLDGFLPVEENARRILSLLEASPRCRNPIGCSPPE